MRRWKDTQLTGLEKTKMLRNAGAYVVLGLALLAMTVFGILNPGFNTTGDRAGPVGVVATVGGEEIGPHDFRRLYRQMDENLKASQGSAYNPALMDLSRRVVEQLVEGRVAYANARNLGLRASDDEIAEYIRELDVFKDEAGKFSVKTFDDVIARFGYTEDQLTADLRADLSTGRWREMVQKTAFVSSQQVALDYRLSETKLDLDYLVIDPAKTSVTIEDKQVADFVADEKNNNKIKEFYDSHTRDYKSEKEVRARHILKSYSGARNAPAEVAKVTQEEAKREAERILAEATQDGADFAALARKYTDEATGKAKGGDLGYFKAGAMVPEFSKVAFEMKAGATSGVVESPFGYHIIRVEAVKEAKDIPLEAAREEIARKLLMEESQPKIAQDHATAISKALAGGGPAAAEMAAAGVAWKSTGSFSPADNFIPGLGSSDDFMGHAASLKKVGDVSAAPLEVRKRHYILRLKSLTIPTEEGLKDEEKKRRRRQLAGERSYRLALAWQAHVKKDLTEKGKIWTNPSYTDFSSTMAASRGPDSGNAGDDEG